MFFSILLLILIWLLPARGNMICKQREQSQLLKFIASLLVVIGHQASFYNIHDEIFMRETALGALCLSFFLFMSGYGLLCGFLKKNKSLSTEWLKKRMVKLIVPALTAMLLYVVAEWVVGKEVDWRNLFIYWFVSDINLRYGWYVTEIIVLYAAFYIAYKFLIVRNATLALCIAISMTVGVMIVMKSPVWYILGLPCFVMGVLLAYYEIKKSKLLISLSGGIRIKVLMSIMVLIFLCFKNFDIVQQFVPFFNKWRYMYSSYFICNIIFIVIISYILMRLPICRVMDKRGGYFYEVYLVQGATLLVCRECFSNDLLFVLIGLFVTVLVAKGMSIVNGRIVRRISC